MEQIIISSFQGGFANDRNRGQAGAFWNAQNIEYRQNSTYVELSKGVQTLFTVPYEVRDIRFWNDGTSLSNSLVVFTADGIYTSTGASVTGINIVGAGQAESKRYFFTSTNIYSFTNIGTIASIDTFTNTTSFRPSVDWFGDLIIGDGNNITRLPEGTTTLNKFPLGSGTIGNLGGTIYQIQVVGANIYIWCNDEKNGDTLLYIWNGESPKLSQVIRYEGKFFHNAININNRPIWHCGTQNGRTEINIGGGYDYQTYIKSGYGKIPISTYLNDEKNRMKVFSDRNYFNRNMTSIGDIAYLPGYGRIYSFGAYLPGDKYSFSCDYTFTGETPSVIYSNGLSGSNYSYSLEGMLIFACKNGSTYDINCINTGIEGVSPSSAYTSSGFIESMEYIMPSLVDKGNDKKIIVPFELGDSSCSIKVYEKSDRGNYNLIKTISTNEYGIGYHVAEILYTNTWRTKQFKFELITTNTEYSPKLYTGITNLYENIGKNI